MGGRRARDEGSEGDGADVPGKARLFVDGTLAPDAPVTLDPGQAYYLRHVLRLEPGQAVTVLNGRDGEWRAEITAFSRQGGEVICRACLRPQPAPGPELALIFAPIRRQRLEVLIEKAVELGVTRLVPVQTDRIAHGRIRPDRIAAQIREAAEQCERLDLPVLEAMRPLRQVLAAWPADWPIYVAAEAGAALPLHQALAGAQAGNAAFVIGPEGGFAPEELAFLAAHPLVRLIGLGPRILRAETAGLAALAIWQALRGDGAARPSGR
jgi:16S rRNA (uracil1498-N3)-methyltransferase